MKTVFVAGLCFAPVVWILYTVHKKLSDLQQQLIALTQLITSRDDATVLQTSDIHLYFQNHDLVHIEK